MSDALPRYLTVAICPGSGHHLECQCLDRAHAADSPIGCPNEVEVEFIRADLPERRTNRGDSMSGYKALPERVTVCGGAYGDMRLAVRRTPLPDGPRAYGSEDSEYVRADLYAAVADENVRLRTELQAIQDLRALLTERIEAAGHIERPAP
jgi:hypothetical protein